MKHVKNFKALCILLGILLLTFTVNSCSGDDNEVETKSSLSVNDQKVIDVKAAASSGSWKVQLYQDSDKDETYHYTGYNFLFDPNGSLTASNGTNTFSGIWSVTNDKSSDDNNNEDDVHFNILFNGANDFSELNDDWHIVSQTSTKIELKDVSGGNGGTDILVFVKN